MRPVVLFMCGFAALVATPPAGADDPAPTADEFRRSADNLVQIVRAVHKYEAANGHLPNDVYLPKSPGQHPILSWRVLIIPYLDEKAYFERVRLDEPWDGQNNKKLIPMMPKAFAPVRGRAAVGETYYRTFSGSGLPFGYDRDKGTKLTAVTDGASNTGLVFEAAEPVVWTKPDDLKLPATGAPRLGGMFGGVAQVGMLDGSVLKLRADPDPAELRKLILPADGGKVNLDLLRAR